MVPYQSVTDAVGPGQANRPVDVALVQDLIIRAKAAAPPAPAKAPAPVAPPAQPGVVDGVAAEPLYDDIGAFQTGTMKTAHPDRIISPGGPTLARLIAGAGAGYKGPAQFNQAPTGQWKSLDQTKFLSLFAIQFNRLLAYNWTQPRPAGLQGVLQTIVADATVQDIRWAAYMLATVQRESPNYLPIEEDGKGAGKEYGKPATYVGKKDKKKYDNIYYGRGYVQLTWLEKYLALGAAVGVDDALAIAPEKVLETDTAYAIMSKGMAQGLFTGKSLPDYIGGDRCDYQSARRIINGTDMWVEMAACAAMIEGLLWLATAAVPVLPGAAR